MASPAERQFLSRIAGPLLLLSILALMPGCAAIGFEVIGPHKADSRFARINGYQVHCAMDHETPVVEASKTAAKDTQKTEFKTLRSPSPQDVVALLGKPLKQGNGFVRYRTGKRLWRGVALDCAVFPVPLTLPLMVPGGKAGYVDIVFGPKEVKMIQYGTASKFYGYAVGRKRTGFYWGSTSGLWFHLD